MEKRFECKNCGKQFIADDNKFVECPHCHSDNVDYASMRKHRWIYIISCIICVAVLCLFIKHCSMPGGKGNVGDSVSVDTMGIKPCLLLKSSKYNKDDTYDCVFSIETQPKQDYKITISEPGESPIAESTDGKFKGLPYSSNDGTYIIRLIDIATDSVLYDLECTEFGRQINIDAPWDESELERRINAGENLVDNPYLSADHKVIILNKHPNDTEVRDKISKVVSSVVERDGHKVSVMNVKYNKLKQISEAELIYDYPKNWFDDDEDDEY